MSQQIKPHLLYLSSDCFFDTDYIVLRHLAAAYTVTWVPLISLNGSRLKDSAPVMKFAEQTGIRVIPGEMKWRKKSFSQLFFDVSLLNQIRREKADVIYIEDLDDLWFYLLQPLFLKKNKTVYALHDVVPHSPGNNLRSKLNAAFFRFTRNLLIHWSDNFHIFSKTEYAHFSRLYPGKNSYYTRLMLDSFGESSLKKVPVENHCSLLFFGLIEYYKGTDILINATESLAKSGFRNFHLTIAGKGEFWSQCESLIKSSELYNLKIRYIQDEEIPDLFSTHHFMVLPYRDASQSGPQMIALNYNLPVIASDAGGLSDFVKDGETGFLCRKGDPESLTAVLNGAILMKNEAYEAMQVKLSAWKKQNYNIEENIAKYIAFFDSMMLRDNTGR